MTDRTGLGSGCRSVALAEALVAFIDGAAGEGASSALSSLLLMFMFGVVALCLVREQRAAERRKRFEAFMAEEAEPAFPNASPSPWGAGGSRQLGPTWCEHHGLRASALVDALATTAASPTPQASVPSAVCGTSPAAALSPASLCSGAAAAAAIDAAADEAALRSSICHAARKDIEERKERRRVAAEEVRQAALRAERVAAEEAAKTALHAMAREMGTAQAPSAPRADVSFDAVAETPTTEKGGGAATATPAAAVPLPTPPQGAQEAPVAQAAGPRGIVSPQVAARLAQLSQPSPEAPTPTPEVSLGGTTPVQVPTMQEDSAAAPSRAAPLASAPVTSGGASLALAEAEFLSALDDL